MKTNISLSLLIREMNTNELIDFVRKLEPKSENQKFLKKAIACYKQLTGKNILVEINKLNETEK